MQLTNPLLRQVLMPMQDRKPPLDAGRVFLDEFGRVYDLLFSPTFHGVRGGKGYSRRRRSTKSPA